MVYPGNPNWPFMQADFGINSNPNYGTGSAPAYTSLTASRRLISDWSTQRGRQYELDSVTAGQWRGTWRNDDAAFDPGNAGSVYAGQVLPYRAFRLRMQWPPTINRLTGDQATGGEATPLAPGSIPAALAATSAYDTNPQIVTSATAWQGTQAFQAQIPASPSPLGFSALAFTGIPIAAVTGTWYTVSAYVRCITSGASPQVAAAISWQQSLGVQVGANVGSTVTLTGSPTASWTRITCSGQVPAAALTVATGAYLQAGGGIACAIQVDGLQWEQASTPSAWVAPGTVYPLYTGMIERYPQSWNHYGNYGLVAPIVVDSFALLSQSLLPDPLTAAIFTPAGTGTGPTFAYLLSDPSSAVSYTDAAGNYNPATITNSSLGPATSVTTGVAQTFATAGGGFAGSTGTVLNLNNPNPGSGTGGAGSVINLLSGGATGPPATSGWTRMVAFRGTSGAIGSNTIYLWSTWGNIGGSFVYWTSAGWNIRVVGAGSNVLGIGPISGTTFDSNWHLLIFGLSSDGSTLNAWMDGAAYTNSAGGVNAHPLFMYQDYVGSLQNGVGLGFTNNYQGDLAYITQWPYLLTNTQATNLYSGWRTAFAGDSSGQRYARILGWAGYAGPTQIDAGNSTSLGAASDVVGQDALSCLEAVVATENGSHFVDAGGTIRFYARSRRYNALTPLYTFGENVAGGEYPYENASTDYDTTHISNAITITQQSTNQNVYANNTTSQAAYGVRTMTRTNQSTSLFECQDAANYLLSRYKDPHERISGLTLGASANTNLWAPALGLELGNRVRVMRRPPSPAPAITIDGFIEQLGWHVQGGSAKLDIQISPVDTTPYALFTTVHATLKNAVSGATSTLTLNPLADAATNPAGGTLSGGQQLVIDQGLATQETVTIAAGGVSVTSPGYTSFTVTLTANTTQTHAISATVTEPLPAGIASVTTYDSAAVFDSVNFAY